MLPRRPPQLYSETRSASSASEYIPYLGEDDSDDERSRRRRDRLEIIYSLLSLHSPQSKTALMRDTRMNFKQVNRYLEDLSAMGMMQFQTRSRQYLPTKRGTDFVKAYEQYKDLRKAAQLERKLLQRLVTTK